MNSETKVVDTNVILVANGQHNDVSKHGVALCATKLQEIKTSGRIAIDDGFLILNEYKNKTSPHLKKRAGDIFLAWLLKNRTNPKKCDQIQLHPHHSRMFESFPEDSDLNNFDDADRKFIAVAMEHKQHPPILQAADAKWIEWEKSLKKHGINVEFVCPDDINNFRKSKSGNNK